MWYSASTGMRFKEQRWFDDEGKTQAILKPVSSWKEGRVMRDYMGRRVTPPKRVTPPPCKHVLDWNRSNFYKYKGKSADQFQAGVIEMTLSSKRFILQYKTN